MKNKIIKYKKRTRLGLVFRNIMKYDDLKIYDSLNEKINQNIKLINDKCQLYIKIYGYEELYKKWKEDYYIQNDILEVSEGVFKMVTRFRDEDFYRDILKYDEINQNKKSNKWVENIDYFLDDKWFEVVWNRDDIEKYCDQVHWDKNENIFEDSVMNRKFHGNVISESLFEMMFKYKRIKSGRKLSKAKMGKRVKVETKINKLSKLFFSFGEDSFIPDYESANWNRFFSRLNELIRINNNLCENFNMLCKKIRKTYPKVILKEDKLGITRLDFLGKETIKVDKVLFDELNEFGIIKFVITRTTNHYKFFGKGYELISCDKLTHYLRVKFHEIISERDVEVFRNGGKWVNNWIK